MFDLIMSQNSYLIQCVGCVYYGDIWARVCTLVLFHYLGNIFLLPQELVAN